MDITNFSASDSLQIFYDYTTDVQFVFSAQNPAQSGVAVNVANDDIHLAGQAFDFGPDMVWVGKVGTCAIIIEGKLYARIALHTSSFSVDDCFALPLPLFAYREEEAAQPISVENNVAGWEIYSPYQPTRIVGFNLPTSLKYTADGESAWHDYTADGGDYGIEFTTPEGATRIAIFDETFWLYLR